MTKLSYEEWEKWYIDTECSATEEEIEEMKNKYYFGINTYDDFKRLLRHEYELYCKG
jgi:hypothetical protein